MFKLKVTYPNKEDERPSSTAWRRSSRHPGRAGAGAGRPACAAEGLDRTYLDDKINATSSTWSRHPAAGRVRLDIGPYIQYPASPRATTSWRGAKAQALLDGRGYVTPQDVKTIGPDVLRHRVSVTYEAEAEEVTPENLLQRIFDHLKVP